MIRSAPSARMVGRSLWFQIHKWIGLILLILFIPLSLSGSMLVWRDWTDSLAHPQRYEVTSTPALLPTEAYAVAASKALEDGERLSSVMLPIRSGKPVIVGVAPAASKQDRQGPPRRLQIWLDPADARLLDKGPSMSGPVRFMHDLHGSLFIRGTGRTIVGLLGVAMFLSAVTGLILWWPAGSTVRRGLRWNRGPLFSGNLHHQAGFWASIPLAILALTGVLIAFPALTGGGGDRMRGPMRMQAPAPVTLLTPGQVFEKALEGNPSMRPRMIQWPSEGKSDWNVTLQGEDGEARFSVDDRTGRVREAPAPSRFIRSLHDGGGYNGFWQTIIFLSGLVPALLGVTGVIMWLRTRGWRGDLARRRKARRAAV